MTTPALQRLREAKPDAHLSLLTHAKLADLWRHHPALNAVLTFQDGESVFAVAKRLRAQRFATALVLPNSPRSALEVFLARIPERIGLARPWRNLFLNRRLAPRSEEVVMHKRSVSEIYRRIANADITPAPTLPASAHHLHQYLHLAAALGAKLQPSPPRLEVA